MSAEPTLGQLIKDAIRSHMLDTHVALPVRVEAYDSTTQQMDVLPLLKRKYKSGELPYAVIPGVPVQWPSAAGGESFIHMPLAVGDTGLAVFVERSMDKWLTGDGQPVLPNDVRINNISDAVFLPGLRTFGAPLENVDAGNMVLQHTNMRITMAADGKISIEGSSEELLGVIHSLIGVLEGAKVQTDDGPRPFTGSTISALGAVKTALETLKRL